MCCRLAGVPATAMPSRRASSFAATTCWSTARCSAGRAGRRRWTSSTPRSDRAWPSWRPEHVFVHAGVVAHGGGALVLPGRSLAGKTTLVAALVAQGAAYLSDEFAVLDAEGAVHPYPKPLSLRVNPDSLAQWDAPVEHFGGVAADRAFRAAIIAVTRYERGAQWRPVRRSPADGAMALLSNAVPARERPAETLAAVRRASADAMVLEGPAARRHETSRVLLRRAVSHPFGQLTVRVRLRGCKSHLAPARPSCSSRSSRTNSSSTTSPPIERTG